MKIYIVNYKETELNAENGFDVQCGTCDGGFKDIKKAIAKVRELAKEKVAECIDEFGYDEDDVSVTNEVFEKYDFESDDDSSEYACVNCGSNTYEYSVYGIVVD